MKRTRIYEGFTIVELLIVIIVVSLLVTIGVVTYNGVQNQARVSAANSDLTAISAQADLYYIKNAKYPTSAGADSPVWKTLLNTAAGDVSDTTKKTFLICRNAAGSMYVVIAWVPVKPSVGDKMYYVKSDSPSASTTTYQGQGGYGSVGAAACSYTLDSMTGVTAIWSYSL